MLLEDMVQWVLSRAKGCPHEEAVDAMRNACIEFCERTYFLTDGSTVTLPLTDTPDLDMTTRVVDIIEERVEGEDEPLHIYAMNAPELDELADDEQALIFADPNTPQLYPAPTEAVTLELLLAYAPGPEADEVPDVLWLTQSEWLKSGALGRVLSIPGEAWSNDAQAAYHLGRFEQRMQRVAAELGRNRLTTSRRLRVKPV